MKASTRISVPAALLLVGGMIAALTSADAIAISTESVIGQKAVSPPSPRTSSFSDGRGAVVDRTEILEPTEVDLALCLETPPPLLGVCCYGDGYCTELTQAECEQLPPCLGDMNCDGQVWIDDINPFVLALASPEGYAAAFPDCYWTNADVNEDGMVDIHDINPFVLTVGNTCPVPVGTWLGPDAECADCPTPVIVVPADLPFSAAATTCGYGNDATEACHDPYDSGEDFVYELNVEEETQVAITLDPHDSFYTAVAVSSEFPPGETCLAVSTSAESVPHGPGCLTLDPGTYYLVIDTWLPPECIEEFDLYIDTCEPAIGRCCYDDPYACADLTEADCDALGGIWDADRDCTIPCPSLEGEDCAHAILVPGVPFETLLETANLTADGPRAACDKFGDGGVMQNDAWLAWTAASDTVAIFSADAEYDAVLAVYDACDAPAVACADETLTGFEQVAFAAAAGETYYLQLGKTGTHPGGGETAVTLDASSDLGACCFTDGPCQVLLAADCAAAGGTFQGELTLCESGACPLPGDSCETPYVLTIAQDTLPIVVANWTTGRGDDYHDTCLNGYDDGADIVFRLDVTETVALAIELDPLSTPFTGMLLSDACPSEGSCVDRTVNAAGSSGAGSTHRLNCLVLKPGTYWLMIDKWLLPAHIPAFELTIEACLTEGACCVELDCVGVMPLGECLALGGNWFWDETCSSVECDTEGGTCATAIEVELAVGMSYQDDNNGGDRGNAIGGDTCLWPKDAAEDAVYRLIITEPMRLEIQVSAMVDPSARTWMLAFALSEACPPPAECILARDVEPYTDPQQVDLEPGEYYLIIEGRPSPSYSYGWAPLIEYGLELLAREPSTP